MSVYLAQLHLEKFGRPNAPIAAWHRNTFCEFLSLALTTILLLDPKVLFDV